jgi:hypothetical protein
MDQEIIIREQQLDQEQSGTRVRAQLHQKQPKAKKQLQAEKLADTKDEW